MHNGTGSGFVWLIPITFVLIGIALGWTDIRRAKKTNRQGQKGDDASLLMFATGSSDISSTSASSSPEAVHYCDPGSHATSYDGGFDSGCGGHH